MSMLSICHTCGKAHGIQNTFATHHTYSSDSALFPMLYNSASWLQHKKTHLVHVTICKHERAWPVPVTS